MNSNDFNINNIDDFFHNSALDVVENHARNNDSCFRRSYAAALVKPISKDKSTLIPKYYAFGVNTTPLGRKTCKELGFCSRQLNNNERGICYESCRSVHAEMDIIVKSSKDDLKGGILYLVGIEQEDKSYVKETGPCTLCKRLIINSGIKYVVTRIDKHRYKIFNTLDWVLNDETIGDVENLKY